MNRWVLLSATLHVAALYGANEVYSRWGELQPPRPLIIDVTIEASLQKSDVEPAPQRIVETPQIKKNPAPKLSANPLSSPKKIETRSVAESSGTSNDNIGALNGSNSGAQTAKASTESNPKPPYPEAARRMKREGTVLLAVHIGSDGAVSSVDISQTSGTTSLDESARETVLRWRFSPAIMNGTPISSVVSVPIKFELKGK